MLGFQHPTTSGFSMGKKSDFVDTGGFNVGGLHTNHKEPTHIEDEDADEVYDLIYDMLGPSSIDGIFTDTIPESNTNSMPSYEEAPFANITIRDVFSHESSYE
ncbi:hypothetical protein Q3G72_021432 [Acer saccharum]|nr:hypothetical protein Q3G72_021432 [Acer saccharum]